MGGHRVTSENDLLCPSARPELADARCFGVRGGEAGAPILRYLDQLVPVDNQLLELSAPVDPTEVFRFAAPCATTKCQHFDGTDCALVDALTKLPAAVRLAPRCTIRRTCRWWHQRGVDACLRCPMVVTRDYSDRRPLSEAAAPRPHTP